MFFLLFFLVYKLHKDGFNGLVLYHTGLVDVHCNECFTRFDCFRCVGAEIVKCFVEFFVCVLRVVHLVVILSKIRVEVNTFLLPVNLSAVGHHVLEVVRLVKGKLHHAQDD